MTLYARSLGYLHAKPFEKGHKSRAERGMTTPPIQIETGGYMLEAFAASGMVSALSFDLAPLSWPEIDAFARHDGLTPDEAATLRKMSEAYVAGVRHGEDLFAIAPWDMPA